MPLRHAAIALGACGLLAVPARAQSITTLYNGTEHGNAGAAMYFDIAVGPSPLRIERFDVNATTAVGVSFPFKAYLTGGTAFGNELNEELWTLVATGSGTGAGLNNPSSVDLAQTFVLDANTSYGIALVVGSTVHPGSTHKFSRGFSNFANPDLMLSAGSFSNRPFSQWFGGLLPDRVWNGTIHYAIVPSPGSLALVGAVFVLSARRTRLRVPSSSGILTGEGDRH